MVFAMCCVTAAAQEPGCIAIVRMGALARARSRTQLITRKHEAGDSYWAQLVFAARSLEVRAEDVEAAEMLLSLLPGNSEDERMAVWMDLSQLQGCESGGLSDTDLRPLFRLQSHLPRLAAHAVLLSPGQMLPYVRFGLNAAYPDSDYAVYMRSVCKARPRELADAIDKLDAKDRQWFTSHFFDPKGCRTIFYPEQ